MSNRRTAIIRATGGLLALLLMLWPRVTSAACGALDLGACVDAVEYSSYYAAAGVGWAIDRTLLQLAYQLDQFRWYLVDTAFVAVYRILTDFIAPAYVPIATFALILACVLFMLVPITGNLRIAEIRHVIVWAVLTPVLITVGGELIGQAEQARAQISTALFAQAARGAPGAIFGVSASDMPAPLPLYPANPCGSGTLARRDGAGLHMDDLAAALLYANAQDIHCPDRAGPSRDIPDGFYATPPGYAFDGYVGNLDSEVERRSAVEGMQRGMTRLFQGIFPCLLADVEALLNLLFALSLLVLWIGIPIGLMFVFFLHTSSAVSGLFRRAVSVLQVSWSSSVVMGVLFSALLAAAQLGNATAYTGFSLGALLVTTYLCFVAGKTLLDSVLTLNATLQTSTGLSLTQPVELTAITAAAAVTGGAGLAAAGLAASEATKSNTYALGAMAGRVPGLAQVGEVAASMGWLDSDGQLYSGLYAGERSLHSWRSFRLQVERAAEEREPAGATRSPRARIGVSPTTAPAELQLDRLGDGARRLILSTGLAAAREDPLVRASAMHLDEHQQVVYTETVTPPALIALKAITVPRAEANIPRLLLSGHHVQENPKEGTVSYWKPGIPAPEPSSASISPAAQPSEQPSPAPPAEPTRSTTATPVAAASPSASPPIDVSGTAALGGNRQAVPQSFSRNARLLASLDSDIATAEQALAQVGSREDASIATQRDQIEQRLARLRRVRTAVARRVETHQPAPDPSATGEDTQ